MRQKIGRSSAEATGVTGHEGRRGGWAVMGGEGVGGWGKGVGDDTLTVTMKATHHHAMTATPPPPPTLLPLPPSPLHTSLFPTYTPYNFLFHPIQYYPPTPYSFLSASLCIIVHLSHPPARYTPSTSFRLPRSVLARSRGCAANEECLLIPFTSYIPAS